ncbi:hypothetical protein MG293_017565 [Ovis ammon polii]|uniref:Uncharacterized protein n=1 Tax=Ovis ammon polii TaxID=230172 RepID=A0AAD4XZR3_OVIAM|nr:hypothetical protein MG293_017565 [Ovis ammon polii]
MVHISEGYLRTCCEVCAMALEWQAVSPPIGRTQGRSPSNIVHDVIFKEGPMAPASETGNVEGKAMVHLRNAADGHSLKSERTTVSYKTLMFTGTWETVPELKLIQSGRVYIAKFQGHHQNLLVLILSETKMLSK